MVTDNARPVSGLTATDFELLDNGVVQHLALVSGETTPLNVFLAFDTSGSLSPERLRALGTAARALFGSLRTVDRVALVTFNHRVSLRSPLTHDPAQLTADLATADASGRTALFDATFLTLSLRESDPGRGLLMLFTDGEDTASWLTSAKVLDAARRSDVVAYVVVPLDPRRNFLSRSAWVDPMAGGFVHTLAKDSGGRTLEADPDGDMGKVFAGIIKEFQNRYLLAYTPAGVTETGWHDVTVKLKHRRGTVTARRGYFASR